jgi:hypothetical protein
MLMIDRFRLHLPGDYRDRAHRIARMVANDLVLLPVANDTKIDRISVPPITVAPGTVDRQIARQIATAVRTRLNGKGKAPPGDW